MAVEEHGGGSQLVRVRAWPRCSAAGVVPPVLLASLGSGAALSQAWAVSVILGAGALLLAVRTIHECATATAAIRVALEPSPAGWTEAAAPVAADERMQPVPMTAAMALEQPVRGQG